MRPRRCSTPRTDHIIARIAREARAAADGRQVLLVAENEPQQTRLARAAAEGGYGLDALWNDDFHHSAHVALTGRREAYYHDYRGAPQEFVSAARYGYLFQGQRYDWQDAPRGTPGLSLPPTAFVTFLENHDQVANSARGLRLHALASHARLRALTALLLLSPQTPMLFQGQEFWASAPFHFFADQGPELDPKIAEGRAESLAQFASLRDPAARSRLPDPAASATFESCRLDWSEVDERGDVLALHRDLLRLRRETVAFAGPREGSRIDGSVLGPEALLLRFFADEPADERLLLVNLGADLPVASVPDPLFAPPAGTRLAPGLVKRGAGVWRRRKARHRTHPALCTERRLRRRPRPRSPAPALPDGRSPRLADADRVGPAGAFKFIPGAFCCACTKPATINDRVPTRGGKMPCRPQLRTRAWVPSSTTRVSPSGSGRRTRRRSS